MSRSWAWAQRILLPKVPKIDGIEIAALTLPAGGQEIGGDFCFIKTIENNGALTIAVGDVCGKGAQAFPIMTYLHGFLTGAWEAGCPSVGSLLNWMNHALFKLDSMMTYTTVICGRLDLGKKTFVYSRAGHPPALLYRCSSHQMRWLDAGGSIAGPFPTPPVPYDEEIITLHPNDLLVFYTDGIIEAWLPETEEVFGKERLASIVASFAQSNLSPSLLSKYILNAARDFNGGFLQDDATLVVVKILQ